MRLKVICTGRSENTDDKGNGVWQYLFMTNVNPGEQLPKQSATLKLTSTEVLHYKRGSKYTLDVNTDSGIEIVH